MKLSDKLDSRRRTVSPGTCILSRILSALLLLIILNSCSTVGKLDCALEPGPSALPGQMQCAPVEGKGRICAAQSLHGGTLLIIEAEGFYGIGPGLLVQELLTEYNFHGTSVSPDGRFMTVSSTAEGHPLMQFFDISNAFTDISDVPQVAGYAPYPGAAWFVEWTMGGAIIESDMDLLLPAGQSLLEMQYPEVYRRYRLLLPEDRLEYLGDSVQ